MFESTNVAVLGAGLMGCGIAQVFASHKVSVLLFDPFELFVKAYFVHVLSRGM